MIYKRLSLLFIALVFCFFAKGQDNNRFENFSLEADYGYGFIMPHHKSIEYFVEDHIRTFDIKIVKQTYGNKYWNPLYRYPQWGAGYYRSNLGNDKVFGNVNAIYSFVKVPFLGSSDKVNLSWQIAFGASYITKYFDIDENPENQAIGSPLNIYIDFSLQTTIPVTNQLAINGGARFTHLSNGKVKSPNTGLNIISGSLGLTYQLSKIKKERIESDVTFIENKNEYSLIYAGGIKTISHYEEGYFFASSLIMDYNRNYSLKRRWNAGVDIFFDGTNQQYSDKNDKADIVNSDLYQVGLHVGHDTKMGRLSLVVDIGAYIYAPVEVLAPVYSRIGLRYRVKDKFIINYTLKSHWAAASYIEWGIGYVF